MGSTPSPPSAPDPNQVANTQFGYTKAAADYQQAINDVNQVTPYGNITYNTVPGVTSADVYAAHPELKGHSNNSPEFTAAWKAMGSANPQTTSTIQLSPEMQALLKTSETNQQSAGTLAGQVLGNNSTAIGKPIDYSSFTAIPGGGDLQSSREAAMQAQMDLLNPQFTREQEQIQTRLANQGLTPGSEAYNNSYDEYNNLKAKTLDNATLNAASYAQQQQQVALAARDQQINEAQAAQQLPLNEFQALTGQAQVTNPQFTAPQSNIVAPPDYATAAANNYQAQLAAYNASTGSSNSLTGNLFGLGGSFLGAGPGSVGSNIAGGIGSLFGAGSAAGAGLSITGSAGADAALSTFAMMSDINVKESISFVGKENGHNIYDFNYKGDPRRYRGVMAQEVQKTRPDAVHRMPNGFLAVDYGRIGVRFREVRNGL